MTVIFLLLGIAAVSHAVWVTEPFWQFLRGLTGGGICIFLMFVFLCDRLEW